MRDKKAQNGKEIRIIKSYRKHEKDKKSTKSIDVEQRLNTINMYQEYKDDNSDLFG